MFLISRGGICIPQQWSVYIAPFSNKTQVREHSPPIHPRGSCSECSRILQSPLVARNECNYLIGVKGGIEILEEPQLGYTTDVTDRLRARRRCTFDFYSANPIDGFLGFFVATLYKVADVEIVIDTRPATFNAFHWEVKFREMQPRVPHFLFILKRREGFSSHHILENYKFVSILSLLITYISGII